MPCRMSIIHRITYDFRLTFERLAELGVEECWRDEWLWGHQAFRKARVNHRSREAEGQLNEVDG